MNPSPQLIEYILDSISQGVSKEDIINSLLEVGWDRETVDSAFSQITNQKDDKEIDSTEQKSPEIKQSQVKQEISPVEQKSPEVLKNVSSIEQESSEIINNDKTPTNKNEDYSELKKQLEDATIGSINKNISDINSTNTDNNIIGSDVDKELEKPKSLDSNLQKDLKLDETFKTDTKIKDDNSNKSKNKFNKIKINKKYLIIGAVISILIILIALGLGVFFYNQAQNTQTQQVATTEQIEEEVIDVEEELQIDSNYIVVFTTTQEFNYQGNETFQEQVEITNQTQDEINVDEGSLNQNSDTIQDLEIQDTDQEITMQLNGEVMGIQDIRNLELLGININKDIDLNKEINIKQDLNIGSVLSAQDSRKIAQANTTLEQYENNPQDSEITAQTELENIENEVISNNENLDINIEDQNLQDNDIELSQDIQMQEGVPENQMGLFFYDVLNNTNLPVSDVIINDDNYLYSLGQWSKTKRYLPIMGMSKDIVTNVDTINVYLYDAQNNVATKIFTEPFNTTQSVIQSFGFDFNATWVTDESFKLIPDQESTISTKRVTSINTIGEVNIEEVNKVQQIDIDNVSFKYNENTRGIEGSLVFKGEQTQYETKPNDYYLGNNAENIILVNRQQNGEQSSILVINTTTNIVTSYPVIIDGYEFLSAQYNQYTDEVIIHLTNDLNNPSNERFMSLDIYTGQFNTIFEQSNSYVSQGLVNQEFYTPYTSFNLAGEGQYIVSKRAYSTIITQGVDIYAKNINSGDELEVCTIVCNDYTLL